MGARGTPEDTSPTRFGTVRPRVQIPGPRPIFCLKTSWTLSHDIVAVCCRGTGW